MAKRDPKNVYNPHKALYNLLRSNDQTYTRRIFDELRGRLLGDSFGIPGPDHDSLDRLVRALGSSPPQPQNRPPTDLLALSDRLCASDFNIFRFAPPKMLKSPVKSTRFRYEPTYHRTINQGSIYPIDDKPDNRLMDAAIQQFTVDLRDRIEAEMIRSLCRIPPELIGFIQGSLEVRKWISDRPLFSEIYGYSVLPNSSRLGSLLSVSDPGSLPPRSLTRAELFSPEYKKLWMRYRRTSMLARRPIVRRSLRTSPMARPTKWGIPSTSIRRSRERASISIRMARQASILAWLRTIRASTRPSAPRTSNESDSAQSSGEQ